MAPKTKTSRAPAVAKGPRAKRPRATPTAANPSCHCCYLLTSSQPGFRGVKTYVGYSTDPWRRLRQHNGELAHGGAKRTAGAQHRPWEHVVVVLGFPSKHMALSFEWAWQHPYKSRRARTATHRLKKAKLLTAVKLKLLGVVSLAASQAQTCVARKLAQLRVMLAECEPYCHLALTVGFANHEYAALITAHEHSLNLPRLPDHMSVQVGAGRPLLETIHARQRHASQLESRRSDVSCALCSKPVLASVVAGQRVATAPATCLSSNCDMKAHVSCLAKQCPDGLLIPRHVACPLCDLDLNWPLVVREYHERMAVITDVESSTAEGHTEVETCDDVEIADAPVAHGVDTDDDDDGNTALQRRSMERITERNSEHESCDDIDENNDDDDDDCDDDDDADVESVAESVVVRRSARSNKVLSRLIPGRGRMVDVICFSSSSEEEDEDDED